MMMIIVTMIIIMIGEFHIDFVSTNLRLDDLGREIGRRVSFAARV